MVVTADNTDAHSVFPRTHTGGGGGGVSGRVQRSMTSLSLTKTHKCCIIKFLVIKHGQCFVSQVALTGNNSLLMSNIFAIMFLWGK